jgi:hypothetical protein
MSILSSKIGTRMANTTKTAFVRSGITVASKS